MSLRNIEDPKAVVAILHRVEPRSGAFRPKRSSGVIDLDADPGVRDFLEGHVSRGLADSGAIAAQFLGDDVDRAKEFDRLLSPDEFVDASRAMATDLFEVAQGDGRISDGTYAFVRYQAGDETHVGVLKLDPSAAYQPVDGTDDDGKPIVRLRAVKDVLPSVRERLQKSVFARAKSGDEHRLLLLDRQGTGGGVAGWFMDFLEVKPAVDDLELLNRFNRVVTEFSQQLRQEGYGAQADDLRRALDGALGDMSIDVEQFAANRPSFTDEQRTELVDEIAGVLGDVLEFNVDRDEADRMIRRKARWRGEGGLRVSMDKSAAQDLLQEEYDDGVWTITITTNVWREVG